MKSPALVRGAGRWTIQSGYLRQSVSFAPRRLHMVMPPFVMKVVDVVPVRFVANMADKLVSGPSGRKSPPLARFGAEC